MAGESVRCFRDFGDERMSENLRGLKKRIRPYLQYDQITPTVFTPWRGALQGM